MFEGVSVFSSAYFTSNYHNPSAFLWLLGEGTYAIPKYLVRLTVVSMMLTTPFVLRNAHECGHHMPPSPSSVNAYPIQIATNRLRLVRLTHNSKTFPWQSLGFITLIIAGKSCGRP